MNDNNMQTTINAERASPRPTRNTNPIHCALLCRRVRKTIRRAVEKNHPARVVRRRPARVVRHRPASSFLSSVSREARISSSTPWRWRWRLFRWSSRVRRRRWPTGRRGWGPRAEPGVDVDVILNVDTKLFSF